MTKILVLGHKGMLGNAVCKFFESQDGYSIVTINDRWGNASFEASIRETKADVIINCIGIIPQRKPDVALYTSVNVDLPLFLDTLGIRVIHPSTDCEFLGNVPPDYKYTKTDTRDADDDYGKSKAESSAWLEHNSKNTKIIRTSIIGHETNTSIALLDWFLHAEGEVRGYTNHFWNGLTTLEWAKQAKTMIESWDTLPVLNQYGTDENKSKYELLLIAQEVYGKEITITPFEPPVGVNKCLLSDTPVSDIKTQLSELKTFYGK